MKTIPLMEVQTDLPKFLRMAEDEEILITEQGKPIGMLVGLDSEDDWSDFLLESDPRFLRSASPPADTGPPDGSISSSAMPPSRMPSM